MQLKSGQVAVITGGGSGIGYALGEEFAKLGLNLVLADIDQEALELAHTSLAPYGIEVKTVPTDVSDEAQVDRLAEVTLTEFGRVDIICNNAGTIGKCMPLWEFERVDWEWILGVDLWGVIHGIRAFVPYLVAQGHGYVINTASMAGLSVVPLNGPYNAAKHAVVSISETLWSDLQQIAPGVGVTVLCPGPTLTRLMTEGGRSRPLHLMPKEDKGVSPLLNPGTFAGSTDQLFSAEQVAQVTLTAVGRDQLYVAPHPGAIDRIDQRVSRVQREVVSLTEAPRESKSASIND
jgi:NAD(P)-dependent dehydrogenase (short-subunit alcohol dehydrogenase family)